MKVLVVFESMYGNTHLIADAIAAGFEPDVSVGVLPVGRADGDALVGVDLLVVGGPTHVHGMSRPSTRKAAKEAAAKPGTVLAMDPDAEGEGLREWFDHLECEGAAGAAFDTRIAGPAAMTGRASKGIAKRLRHLGLASIAPPESFLVSKNNALLSEETDRARAWGAALDRAMRRTASEAAPQR